MLPNSSAALVNASTPPPTATAEEIAAADLISSANLVYSLLAAAAFVAGCFLLYVFVHTYRAHRRLAWLDRLLWAFCGLQLLLLLFSFYNVVHRPRSLRTAALGCAALSFAINAVSLGGLLVLALMAYVLTFDPSSNYLMKRPGVCAALVALTSAFVSLLLAGVRGPGEALYREADCSMDPLDAGVSYAVAKLCLTFLIPYALQLTLVICGCVRQRKSNWRFVSSSDEGPAFLAVSATLLFCHLLYTTVLVRGARLRARGELSHRERALASVAELVFFAGSGASLVLVALTHRPSRERLCGLFRRLADCCPRAAHPQPNRNIITPHIEIADTLQDIES
ncbi:uncharacterized protein LOC109530197 [Hippocampus comes]|uniref:uncharacterized protein LOC109530197 n=1 Tax=Hippocampus comes TaxID=109280 RepID=UPI00094E42FC|nr:PREDICTED: uncharacterized protein LOC109530197 [Hippocampus comes]